METVLIHLVKSTALTLLFLISYLIFLRKETFYYTNRLYLILGLLISVVLPFFQITKTIWVERAPITYGDVTIVESAITTAEVPFNWNVLFITTYLMGASFFAIRLLIQLWSIKSLKRKSDVVHENDIKHVRSRKQLSPFSFFKNIFYCPAQYDHAELNAIITHEKAHARQHHSIDVLFMQVICLLLWFNPLVWIYKYYVKQNLEFLADHAALQQVFDKKQYQYLMLKQAVGERQLSITNPFFNTLIKKRIVMLNQKQSKPINSLKLLFILPFLVVFLVSFNSREVVKFSNSTVSDTLSMEGTPEFVSPLHPKDIKEVSSGFGPAKNPFSNKMDFHNGIDLVASSGKPVMASADGSVSTSAADDKKGNFLVIDHEDGFSTKYMHLERRSVNEGDDVVSGTIIGYVGTTGESTGPHLHFEILESGKSVNPSSFIPFKINDKNVESQVVKKDFVAKKGQSIELLINKTTTNEDLERMKKDLAEDEIDFSYTTVRNDDKEIIDISIQISGKNEKGETFSGNYASNSDGPIDPLVIFYDDEANVLSIGNSTKHHLKLSNKGDHTMVWNGLDEIGEHEDIVIIKEDGSKKVILNGKEIDQDSLQSKELNVFVVDGEHDGNAMVHISSKDGKVLEEKIMKIQKGKDHVHIDIDQDDDAYEKHIKVKRGKSKKDKNVFIVKDTDEESDVEVLNLNEGFFFVDTDGKDPLYIIDGKEATKKEVKKLSPKKIATIDVSKGEAAIKKYGNKAKDGVVEIIMKNKD